MKHRILSAGLMLSMLQLTAQMSVTTWHNDNWHNGSETTLTTALVHNKNQFGKICTAGGTRHETQPNRG